MIELRDYQSRTITMVYDWLSTHEGNLCVVAPTGCHAKGTGILMADGSTKKVEDIVEGDRVMGGDGTGRTVISLHHGEDEMFRIIPVKGNPFIVNGGHILSLISTPEGKRYPGRLKGDEITNISVFEYQKKSGNFKHTHKLYRGKVDKFEVEESNLCIPPYVLGLLLGDGCLLRNRLEYSNPDVETYKELYKWADSIDCMLKMKFTTSGCPTFEFRGKKRFWRDESTYGNALKEIGLKGCGSESKFIPKMYLTSSVKDRLDILAGLLDTDGSLGKNTYDFISKSEQLAKDVCFIAKSLGLYANLSECTKSCQTGFTGTYYRVCISGDTERIPCRIKRKKASPRQQKKRVNVTGFFVEPIGKGEYFGFECDGDHLYMMDDFTVTHNSGKSWLIAGFIQQTLAWWPTTKILVLTHQKELIEQDVEKLLTLWPLAPVGICSASLNQHDTKSAITFASIQTLANQPLNKGDYDICLIDEAHLVNNNESGNYRKVLSAIGCRVIGLTATAYRLGQGMLTEGESALFDDIIEPVKIEELQARGYLSYLRSKSTFQHYDTEGLAVRNGDYSESEMERRFNTTTSNKAVAKEIVSSAKYYDRKHWLVFCSSVKHAQDFCQILTDMGVAAACLTGQNTKTERETILSDFKAGRLTCLTSVGILTTGFDYPGIDLLAVLRPTKSPGLHCQILGRGLRIAEGKKDCLVLDFAGNIKEHGVITAIKPPKAKTKGKGVAPCKTCPECLEIVPASARVCSCCGYEFPVHERIYELYYGRVNGDEEYEQHDVSAWFWQFAVSRKSGKEMIRLDYQTENGVISEYFCVFHDGWTANKARKQMKALAEHYGLTIPDALPMEHEDWEALVDMLAHAPKPAVIITKEEGGFSKVCNRLWAEDIDRILSQYHKENEAILNKKKEVLAFS